MNRGIELHDSVVCGIVRVGKQVVLFLKAYLHTSKGVPGRDAGDGWIQAAALLFREGAVTGQEPEYPADIGAGRLFLQEEQAENGFPAPFHTDKSVTLTLEMTSGETLSLSGGGAELVLIGEAAWVETFPGSA